MALIKCPECGKEISDKSDKCIHCGFPVYMKVNMAIEKVKCDYCGALNEVYQLYCNNCGASIEKKKIESFSIKEVGNDNPNVTNKELKKVCQFCNGLTPINSDYCLCCGRKITLLQTKNTVGKKNKWVSLLLCIFLGYFGAHKFYERKIGMGILYFLTMGLFAIGWMVDIVIIALKPEYYD